MGRSIGPFVASNTCCVAALPRGPCIGCNLGLIAISFYTADSLGIAASRRRSQQAVLRFDGDDATFCRHITTEAGATALPVSGFYSGEASKNFIRFYFAKQDVLLDEAVARLAAYFGG